MPINSVFIYLCDSDAAARLDLLKCTLLRRYFSSYINVPGQTSTLWILLILDAELEDDLSRLEAGAERMGRGWLGGRGADREQTGLESGLTGGEAIGQFSAA